jgi:hypothetical protein
VFENFSIFAKSGPDGKHVTCYHESVKLYHINLNTSGEATVYVCSSFSSILDCYQNIYLDEEFYLLEYSAM